MGYGYRPQTALLSGVTSFIKEVTRAEWVLGGWQEELLII
ncbi:uncharacterized protein MP3633_1173 [Marinomonas primoryensis]|uniref:Uncharacterized protein n=1 Tax=Marinomonas primoryensis TaxID=178399 RepID=A0A859CUE5_9GAMM|nr:uncharacterized protein MP3633_1173 [Marinomonas primoryensis]